MYVKEILMQETMRCSKNAGRKSRWIGTQYRAPEAAVVALRLMCAMLRRSDIAAGFAGMLAISDANS